MDGANGGVPNAEAFAADKDDGLGSRKGLSVRGLAENELRKKLASGCSWRELKRVFNLVTESSTDEAYFQVLRLLWEARGSDRRAKFFEEAMGRRTWFPELVMHVEELEIYDRLGDKVPARRGSTCLEFELGGSDGIVLEKSKIFCVSGKGPVKVLTRGRVAS